MMPRNRRSRRRTALAAVLCTSIGDVVRASVTGAQSPTGGERTYASVVSGSSRSVGVASPTARPPASTVSSTRPTPRISQPTPRTFFEFEISLQMISKTFDWEIRNCSKKQKLLNTMFKIHTGLVAPASVGVNRGPGSPTRATTIVQQCSS